MSNSSLKELILNATSDNESSLNHLELPPASVCLFCDRRLESVGGKRIAFEKKMGVRLSTKKAIRQMDAPYRKSVQLFDEPAVYLHFWGEEGGWSDDTIQLSKLAFLAGRRPWFCQVCGKRYCSSCGSPFAYPIATDILHEDGRIRHCAIFPFDPGCINPHCPKYRGLSVREPMVKPHNPPEVDLH